MVQLNEHAFYVQYRTPCVNEVFLLCANRTVSLHLVMNVLRWIVLSHCVYRVSNCCLSVI